MWPSKTLTGVDARAARMIVSNNPGIILPRLQEAVNAALVVPPDGEDHRIALSGLMVVHRTGTQVTSLVRHDLGSRGFLGLEAPDPDGAVPRGEAAWMRLMVEGMDDPVDPVFIKLIKTRASHYFQGSSPHDHVVLHYFTQQRLLARTILGLSKHDRRRLYPT